MKKIIIKLIKKIIMAFLFLLIRLLELIHRGLSFCFRLLESENVKRQDVKGMGVREIEDYYGISYRQARKIYHKNREVKKPKKLLDILVMGKKTSLFNDNFKMKRIGRITN